MPQEFSPDPVKNRARHVLLTKLAANTTNPAAAELARELLAGNITPRGVMSSPSYGDVLTGNSSGFTEWYGNLSESEKDAQAEAGRKALSQLASDDKPAQPSQPPADEEDFSEVDWLDG